MASGDGISRRTMIKWTALAAGATVLVPSLIHQALDGSPRYRAFEFSHGDAVAIIFAYGRTPDRYDIAVRRGSEVVETIQDVDPMRLHELESAHFTVTYHDAPTAAAA